MKVPWIYALASVFLVSLVSLIGITFISVEEKKLRSAIFVLVSLAAGALLGDAFIHLLPQAFDPSGATPAPSFFALSGILTFFALEKLLLWRHHHTLEPPSKIQPLGYINLFADGIHNLIDGALIGASFLVSVQVGIATMLAVVLHEIPQEIGDFAVLLQSGFSRKRALLFNFLSALLAVAGAIFSLTAGSNIKSLVYPMLPFTAGGFIYIAVADLLPELQKERKPLRSLMQFAAILTGIGLMFLLTLAE